MAVEVAGNRVELLHALFCCNCRGIERVREIFLVFFKCDKLRDELADFWALVGCLNKSKYCFLLIVIRC